MYKVLTKNVKIYFKSKCLLLLLMPNLMVKRRKGKRRKNIFTSPVYSVAAFKCVLKPTRGFVDYKSMENVVIEGVWLIRI